MQTEHCSIIADTSQGAPPEQLVPLLPARLLGGLQFLGTRLAVLGTEVMDHSLDRAALPTRLVGNCDAGKETALVVTRPVTENLDRSSNTHLIQLLPMRL
jgi:hypothetical protein